MARLATAPPPSLLIPTDHVIKSHPTLPLQGALAPITNAALHGNFNPLGNYGYGGYGGLENYAGKVILLYSASWDHLVP